MIDLLTNGYVQFALFILSSLRWAVLELEDKITRPLRNWLLKKKPEGNHDIEQENMTDPKTKNLYPAPGKIVKFLRVQFSCQWCLPFWSTSLILLLTLLFPIPMTIFNLFFGSAFIVSFIYGEVH